MTMTSRARMLTALNRGQPDRLPATTHHLMPYFLNHYLDGKDSDYFFARFQLDAIRWIVQLRQTTRSENWRLTSEDIADPQYQAKRWTIHTPKGDLTSVLQSNEYTTWSTEFLVKRPQDIQLYAAYAEQYECDVDAVNQAAAAFGERGLVRGHIVGSDFWGQPGCWQEAAMLFGIQNLIMATYDDPDWVHEFLGILRDRRMHFVKSLKGAKYDLLELGGGDASTTVISPRVFEEFVAPYDAPLVAAAHAAGQKIVYHTCGGMMPILEQIADMGVDAIETLTSREQGADVDLKEAKRRIGHRVCMIGGFNQAHYLKGCPPEATRAYVRKCFEEAGPGGGYIMAPSDHFFDVDMACLEAFADEARRCVYR